MRVVDYSTTLHPNTMWIWFFYFLILIKSGLKFEIKKANVIGAIVNQLSRYEFRRLVLLE